MVATLRRRIFSKLGWLAALTTLAATAPLGWPKDASGPVQHYGYSGQEQMLACIQQAFGKYAAAFPHTILYGSPPIDLHNMEIVNGSWAGGPAFGR